MISLQRNVLGNLNIHLRRNIKNARHLCSGKGQNPFDQDDPNRHIKVPNENPFKRTFRILGDDVRSIFGSNVFSSKTDSTQNTSGDNDVKRRKTYQEDKFQTHCDIAVIGGGGMGSSIAYWLKKRAREGLNVVVIEKDPTYKAASTTLSVGGLRQQFSLEENIQMSLYGADFIRNAKEHLGDDIELNFTPYGYLLLSSEQSAEELQRNSKLQNELGARNELLTAKRLKEKFPWLNTDGIALGCHGLEKEGWFDPWALLCGYKRRAQEYGAHYVDAEVIGFEFRNQPDMMVEGVAPGDYNGLERIIVKMPDGEIRPIKFAICVNAAGPQSAKICEMARIGTGPGMLCIPLPVEPRKRYVYVYSCENETSGNPGLNTPLVVDPSNTYFRREGLSGLYIAGRSPPTLAEEPPIDNLDVDYNYFDSHIWPHLAHRVPKFEAIKVKNAWAGYYELNTFDENGIIGPHPYYNNFYLATGFSGHGIQQTAAVGRAISELIIDGCYRSIDLTRLGFDRIIVDAPMREVNIV